MKEKQSNLSKADALIKAFIDHSTPEERVKMGLILSDLADLEKKKKWARRRLKVVMERNPNLSEKEAQEIVIKEVENNPDIIESNPED